MTAAPAGGGLAEVLAVLAKAGFGELSVSGSGCLLDDGRVVGDGVYGPAAPAIAATVNYLRSHGEDWQELIAAVTEQIEWLDTPEVGKFSSEAMMLHKADQRVRAALAKVASNGGTK